MTEPSAAGAPLVRSLLARLALIGCALMAAVVVSSAYMRLSAAGLGCDGWPQCYGRAASARTDADGTRAPATKPTVAAARIVHRVAALAIGILVLLAGALVLTRPGRSVANIACAAGLLGLTLSLAVLGRATSGLLSPAVTVANLAGGHAMLALFWVLWLHNRPGDRRTGASAWLRMALLFAGLLLIAQSMLGALVSAKFASLACADTLGCLAASENGVTLAGALDPTAVLMVDERGRVVPPPGAARLNGLHRALGFIAALVLIGVAVGLARRAPRRRALALVLAVAVAMQVALGWGMLRFEFPLPLALLHNAGAVLLLLLLIAAVHAARARASASTASA